MPYRRLETLLEGGMVFECPRWHDGRWYITDIFKPAVVTLQEDGSDVRNHVVFNQKICGTGWLPDGSLLVVALEERRLLRIDGSATVADYAALGYLGRGVANDLVVDGKGRAFVGLLGFEASEVEEIEAGGTPPPGVIVRVDPDGTGVVAADGVISPNGMVITEDGSTLIVGESFAARYTAFTIGEDGGLTDRRVWAKLEGQGDKSARPDGCTMDAEGCIWFADAHSGRFVRISEGGEELEEVRHPGGWHTYACMLGGKDGRTFVMCCGPGHSPEQRSASQHVVLSTTVEVPHAGLP